MGLCWYVPRHDLESSVTIISSGQTCSAEGIYDEFINKFVAIAKAQAAKKGDPFEAMPQVSQTQLDRVVAYIGIAKKEGAEFHTGGPTIMSGNNNTKSFREEIFGPVAVIIKFKTEGALEIANYGLAAGVFTENSARSLRMAHNLDADTLWVSNYSASASGLGRECVKTRVKAVHVNLG
ncbi:Aldedh-domain-containing protein [Hymenopellis radicata]|nr:Aldedh-domain-containing protein [Hymenopellis radicata]